MVLILNIVGHYLSPFCMDMGASFFESEKKKFLMDYNKRKNNYDNLFTRRSTKVQFLIYTR